MSTASQQRPAQVSKRSMKAAKARKDAIKTEAALPFADARERLAEPRKSRL